MQKENYNVVKKNKQKITGAAELVLFVKKNKKKTGAAELVLCCIAHALFIHSKRERKYVPKHVYLPSVRSVNLPS